MHPHQRRIHHTIAVFVIAITVTNVFNIITITSTTTSTDY